jgi:lipoprotein-anchoring transpeptidase ErfK/SrfK
LKRFWVCWIVISLSLAHGPRPARADSPAPLTPDFRYPSLFPPAPTVGPAPRRITVDLSRQELIAFEGMTPVRAFAVSTGDYDHPTIVGEYAVQWKRDRIDLIGPDWYFQNVPYVMMFAKPFYIHAAPWRAEFGKPDSHGCVTLAESDAGWLFDWADVGTPIYIGW